MERLLAARLGKYIAGLERDNLSVTFWSGEIALENASIRPEALTRLQLPLRLALGRIQSLRVKIPWRKLASESVEIELAGLYLVLVPVEGQAWTYDKSGFVRLVKERLELHEIRRVQSQSQKLLSAEEVLRSKSFLQRLTAKVLDNLRITVRDIHIRFEFRAGLHAFSSGVMLAKVDYCTTSAAWKHQFTDRQQRGRAGQDIYKLLTCERLALYFETDEVNLLHLQPETALEAMRARIADPGNLHFVLEPMHIQARVVHNSDLTDFSRPRYRAEVELPEFQLTYDQRQFHCSVRLVDFVTDYWQFLRREEEKKKYRAFLPLRRTPRTLWQFAASCIIKRIRQRKDSSRDHFVLPRARVSIWEKQFKAVYKCQDCSPAAIEAYEDVLDLCPFDQVCEWASQVLQRLEEQSPEHPPEHRAQIQYSDLVRDVGEDVLLVPADFKWLQVSYRLSSGLLRLRKTKREAGNSEEGLDFRVFELRAKLSVLLHAFTLKLTVEDCDFSSWESDHSPVPFCLKVNPANTLLALRFKLHPQDLPAVTFTQLEVSSAELRYSPLVLALGISFFAVPKSEESGKTASWEQLEPIKEKPEGRKSAFFSSEEHCVRLDLSSVSLVLSLTSQEEFLAVKVQRALLRNEQFDLTKDLYERFLVELQGAEVTYTGESGLLSVVSPCQIALEIGHLLPVFRDSKNSDQSLAAEPDYRISVASDSLRFGLCYCLYQRLLRLSDFLRIDEEAWQAVALHKKAIMRKAVLFDLLHSPGQISLFTVLSEGYLYFFSSPQAAFASGYFYLKDCEVRRELDLELTLTNKSASVRLIFEVQKQVEKWEKALKERVKDLQDSGNKGTGQGAERRTRWEVKVRAGELELGLAGTAGVLFVRVESRDCQGTIVRNEKETVASIAMGTFQILDLLVPRNFPVLLSESSSEGVNLLVSQAVSVPSDQPKPLSVSLGFRSLVWNWTHSTLSALFHFFDPVPVSPSGPRQLLDFTLSSRLIRLYLVCGDGELALVCVSFHQANLLFSMRPTAYEFSGKFKSLSLVDTSDYPKTAKHTDFGRLIPREVLIETADSPQSFALIMPDATSGRYTENKPNVFRMVLVGTKVNYLHQPVCRLVEFFNGKLLGLFDPVLRLAAMKRTEQKCGFDYGFSLPSTCVPDPLGKLTQINIKLAGVKLALLPRPYHPDSFLLSLHSLAISNSPAISNTRHLEEPVPVDLVKFEFRRMGITCNELLIVQPVELTVTLERLLATEKASKLPTVDRSYQLDIRGDTFGMALEQAHYNLILKLFDLNFTYDDQLDRLFFPDTTPTPIDPQDEGHMGVFLQVTLDLRRLGLTLLKDKDQLADIDFGTTVLRMWKYCDGYMELELNAQLFLMMTPKNVPLQRFRSQHNCGDSPVSPVPMKGHFRAKSFTQTACDIVCRPLEAGAREVSGKLIPALRLTMKKQRSCDKEIVINFGPLHLSFSLAFFFQLQYFFYYGLPDYDKEQDTPFDYMRQYRPQVYHTHNNIPEDWEPPKVHVNVYFERSLIVFPLITGAENTVCEGEVLFTYSRNAIESEEYQAVIKKLECCQVETFACARSDLESSEDTQFLAKRKIIEPVDISYESIQMAKGRKRLGSLVHYSTSRLQLLTTFSDLQLLQDTVQFQSLRLSDEANSLTSLLQVTPLSLPNQSPDLQRRRLSLEPVPEDSLFRPSRSITMTPRLSKAGSLVEEWDFKRKYTCEGVSVVALNDRVAAFTPALDLAVSRFEVVSDIKKTSSMEHTELTLRVQAYNPVNDSWEPLIEPFSLILQKIWNEAELPETQWLISVSNDAPLDLTLSEETVKRLYRACKDWLKPRPQTSLDSSGMVSPFTVCNKTSLLLVLEQWVQGRSRRSWIHEENMCLPPGSSKPFYQSLQSYRVASVEAEQLHFILKDGDHVVEEFSGVNLKRVHTEARELQLKGRLCSVIVDVVMEATGKKIELRSPVEFQNDTEVDFWLLFTEQERCAAGETTPVPLHLCRALVSLLPRVPEASSWLPIDLHELNSPAEISAGDAYFLLIPKLDESGLKTVVHITAPILIRSAVPLPMKVQLESNNGSVAHLLNKGETCRVHAFSSYDNVSLVLSFQSYMTSQPTLIASRRQECARSVKLMDTAGEDLDLYLDYRKEGNLLVTVYSAMVIINSTALPLTFYYKKTGAVRRIPGQLNPAIVLSDTCRKLCLGLDRCRSRPFKTGAAGAINIITVDTEEDDLGDSIRYQFVYNVEVAWLFPTEVIYTRVVTVTPRFIFVNALTEELLVKQAETNECCLSVRPGDQMPFYWPNGSLRELVQVTVGQGRYSWSGALVISSIGVTSFCCLPLEPTLPLLHLRAEVKFTDLSVLVSIEEETDKYCTYRLENLSTRISFCVYQESNPEAFQWLDVCSSIVFSWKEPALAHKIVAEMFLGQLTALPVKSGSAYWFSPDNMNDMSKIKIEFTDELGQYITARTLNIGTCKVLRFYDSVLRLDDTREAERAATQVTVTVPRLGISLVETDAGTSEVVYLSLSRLELRATRSVISQQVEIIVDRVQIDNQHSLRACFPVLLAPKANTGHGKPTISCKLDYHLDQSPNCFHVQVAEIQVQPLIVQVESLLMVRLMALWQRLVPSSSESEAFQHISTRSGLRSQAVLKGLMIPQAERSFYLRQLRLHVIQISLSFLPVKDMDDRDNDTFTAFIHAVGMVVSTIDSAPIEFEAVEKNDLVGMQKQIFTALWLSYRSQLASQLLSLIGHANVLGNPVGLLDGLGRGVADFFSAPAQGMRSGPLDAGIGLIKGAESLLKNTVSATFGSVSKLTGTMATGLSALTQDKYFLSERQRESVTARPSNVVEGVEMGVKSLFRSFGKGLAGVVTEPLKGAKRDGFTGLLSGSLKGIGGLMAQPVAGIFDMTSRTAEGIMNTAVDSVATLQRVRDPRVVYGLSCKLLPYRAEDAAVRLYVAQLKKGKYMRDHYVCHMQVQDRKNVKCFIVLSVQHLLLVLMHSHKVIYEIKCEDMLTQRLVDKGLEIRTLPSSFKVSGRQKTLGTQVFTLPIHSREMLERMHKKLQKLIRPRDFAVPF